MVSSNSRFAREGLLCSTDGNDAIPLFGIASLQDWMSEELSGGTRRFRGFQCGVIIIALLSCTHP